MMMKVFLKCWWKPIEALSDLLPDNFFLPCFSFIFRVVRVHWANRGRHDSSTRLELCSSYTRRCCATNADCYCCWWNFLCLCIAGRFRWSNRRRVCTCFVVLMDGRKKTILEMKKASIVSCDAIYKKLFIDVIREALTLHFKRNSMELPTRKS